MTQMSQVEIEMDKQSLVYILCLSQWNGTMKDLLTNMDNLVFNNPSDDVYGPHGELIEHRCY